MSEMDHAERQTPVLRSKYNVHKARPFNKIQIFSDPRTGATHILHYIYNID